MEEKENEKRDVRRQNEKENKAKGTRRWRGWVSKIWGEYKSQRVGVTIWSAAAFKGQQAQSRSRLSSIHRKQLTISVVSTTASPPRSIGCQNGLHTLICPLIEQSTPAVSIMIAYRCTHGARCAHIISSYYGTTHGTSSRQNVLTASAPPAHWSVDRLNCGKLLW